MINDDWYRRGDSSGESGKSRSRYVNQFLKGTNSRLLDERYHREAHEKISHYTMNSSVPIEIPSQYSEHLIATVELKEEAIRDMLTAFEQRDKYHRQFLDAMREMADMKTDLDNLIAVCNGNAGLKKHLEELRFLAKLEGYNGKALR